MSFLTGRPRRSAQALPCLLVDDLDRAAEYYRDVLGFERIHVLGRPPSAVVAERSEGSVILQLVTRSDVPVTRRHLAPRAWDALIYARRLDRIASDLHERNAPVQFGVGITDVSDRTLEVRDAWGNVLVFAEGSPGVSDVPGTDAWRLLPRPVRGRLREEWSRRSIRRHREAFQAFYDRLPDQDDVFYMFFTGGLLHWVLNAERLVPRQVNLVLVGSGLTDAEREFLARAVDRPFHHIDAEVDDNTVWELLFAINRRNFGYLDIDCFVLEPSVFSDLTAIEEGVAVNAAWTYEAAPGLSIGCTHLVFLNVAAIENLRRSGHGISPANHDWTGSAMRSLHEATYCRIPTERQRRDLLATLPPDQRGRATPPGGGTFFDTLVAYQVVAKARGYRTRAVRPLRHRTQALLNADPDRRVWQQDMSDELIHVGGVSYYWKFFHLPEFRLLYLAVERTMLGLALNAGDHALPPQYEQRLAVLDGELGHLGFDGADAAREVRRHLTVDRGLLSRTSDRLLDRQDAGDGDQLHEASRAGEVTA